MTIAATATTATLLLSWPPYCNRRWPCPPTTFYWSHRRRHGPSRPREPTDAAIAAAVPASSEAKTGLEDGHQPPPPLPNQNVDPFHNIMMGGCCGDHHENAMGVKAETVAGYLLSGLFTALTIGLWSIIAVRACQGQPFEVGMLSLVAETWEVYRRPSQPPSVMPRRSTLEQFYTATAWVPAAWLWLLVAIAAVGGKNDNPSEFVKATSLAGTWTYVRQSISIQH
jgi:nitrate reductase NapE component